MPHLRHLLVLLIAAPLAAPWAGAQTRGLEPPASNEQVIVPEVQRRDVRLPRFPSKDWSISLIGGTYATQNFGASLVGGVRLGYHLSEDFFVEATYAQTKVSDDSFRQILPGGVFTDNEEKLTYYNLSLGYNVLPGEVFLGADRALASALYVIGGIGSTKFNDRSQQTFNLGFGWRVLLSDRSALQLDVRDHIFSLDLLGRRESTQNLELTAGFTYYF